MTVLVCIETLASYDSSMTVLMCIETLASYGSSTESDDDSDSSRSGSATSLCSFLSRNLVAF